MCHMRLTISITYITIIEGILELFMLKDILTVIFSMFKSRRVAEADCQVSFDEIANNYKDISKHI